MEIKDSIWENGTPLDTGADQTITKFDINSVRKKILKAERRIQVTVDIPSDMQDAWVAALNAAGSTKAQLALSMIGHCLREAGYKCP